MIQQLAIEAQIADQGIKLKLDRVTNDVTFSAY